MIAPASLLLAAALGQEPQLEVRPLTSGPKHHSFGYIGHVRTIPWNEDGSLIVGLRTGFQDRLPRPEETADIVLIDASGDGAVRKVDETRAWNFQQGTMLYWNPRQPKTQFFFNDRDPSTGRVFCALHDVEAGRRVREFRFDGVPVGNGGVAPDGRAFAAINYGRMARLRPVTGYPGAHDPTDGVRHPADDGVFVVDVERGTRTLIASFAALADVIRRSEPSVDGASLFVNHTLWSRDGGRLFFFVRGGWEGAPGEPRINASFVVRRDGSGLARMKEHIGGHPEWDSGAVMIGRKGEDQVLYDVDRQEVVGTLGSPELLPDPEGDIALSPDGAWFVNGYRTREGNRYAFLRRADGRSFTSPPLPIDRWTKGPLRIDPSPCWNRRGDRILVTALADDEARTRQMFVIRLLPVRLGPHAAETRTVHDRSTGLPSDDVPHVEVDGLGRVVAVTAEGAARLESGRWVPVARAPDTPTEARQTARARDGRVAEARADGLFLKGAGGAWERLLPRSGRRSWAPVDVRGVAFDSEDRLWFASPQGVGRFDGRAWTLWTGADGLPFDDFTTVAAGEPGVAWFGTRRGAIRFDGRRFEYRQGRRWLPDDEVRSIAVLANGDAWIATAAGLSHIARRPMTLAEKARFFEDEIDRRHRRTPYGYVHPVRLAHPGDLTEWTQTDSDNDGLWTAMYGAGECYACAVTRSPLACDRARRAFEALRFLGEVTQGGAHPAPRGFVARSILPRADGPDPNLRDSPGRDRERQTRDRRWKAIAPRWPRSATGRWFWKSDTSSDELDGHYFFYGLYHDLVPKSPGETERLRAHVAALTDHLLEHGYRLVDHDGRPTRWGFFDPASLDHDPDWWEERGLNSMSLLAYLKVAGHVTGGARYAAAARELVERHAYAANVLIPKTHLGPGAGNQSDDEMAFMNLYGLIRYEADPGLRKRYLLAFHHRFQNEQPERNPLFNFVYAAVARGQSWEDAFGTVDLSPQGDWLEDAVDTLQRFPLDRVNWGQRNAHRKDLVLLPPHVRGEGLGHRVDGKVLPVDERYVGHWNHDPWRLDHEGDGLTLGDGSPFLLPYYLGLYHGFLRE